MRQGKSRKKKTPSETLPLEEALKQEALERFMRGESVGEVTHALQLSERLVSQWHEAWQRGDLLPPAAVPADLSLF